jgi:polysaccharide biosynthesis protein PslG
MHGRSPSPMFLVRLAVFAVLLWLIQPSPALVVLGPKQVVQTAHPMVAVHTRLTDEVEEWKIQRTLQMVREMGATTIVEFFPWAYYQGEDGYIAWEHQDMVVNHAHQQGLQVIARIGMTPEWARPPETSLNYLDETAYDDFALFTAAFATRYAGKVQAIIVGNEPNLSFEWGYRPTTAEDYVALLAAVYPAIKQTNPDMVVLGGALAPTLEPDGSPWGLNDLIYLERMYEAGAADYMDGLAAHTYGFKFPPDMEPAADIINFRRVELWREIMLRYGDDSPIYITETGWNDSPRWTRAVRPAQRLQYTVAAMQYAEENWPYVPVVAVWMFRTPAPTRSYMDYYTLVTPEFIAKPLYEELQRYTQGE